MSRDSRVESDSEAVTPVTIPVSAVEVAECAREALLEFMSGAASGWGKRELAAWLVGPYRCAVVAEGVHSSRPPSSEGGSLAPARVEELVRTTRDALLDRIAWVGTRAAIIGGAVDSGMVVPCVDVTGKAGWVATQTRARASLRARVEALVAVDALVRPLDYRDLLVVCKRCRAVSFDAAAHKKGECSTHRISGVQTRHDAQRMPVEAEEPTLRLAR